LPASCPCAHGCCHTEEEETAVVEKAQSQRETAQR
jgi:hypothetical protein